MIDPEEDDESRPEPLHELLVLGSNYGEQRIGYRPRFFSKQDATRRLFFVLFRGMLVIEGHEVTGKWTMIVKGEGLAVIESDLHARILPMLRRGPMMYKCRAVMVESITFGPRRMVGV